MSWKSATIKSFWSSNFLRFLGVIDQFSEKKRGKKSFVPFRLSFDEIVGANKCTAKKKRNWQENKKSRILSRRSVLLTFSGLVYIGLYFVFVCIFVECWLVWESWKESDRATALFLVSKVVVRGRLLTRKGRLSLVSAALYIRIRLVCIKETQKTLKILTKNWGH